MVGSIEHSRKQFERMDAMPEGLRACAHEYGLPIVNACIQLNITNPRAIHNLVREIWDGARQPLQRKNRMGKRQEIYSTLDWLLLSKGGDITAETLVRFLWERGLVIVSREPTPQMIEASKATVSGFSERVTKTEKHRKRLRAAIFAAAKTHWPHLFEGAGD